MNTHFWTVPKYKEQNEDHWAIPNDPTECPIVLCDGASESFNSTVWAELLSQGLKKHEAFTDKWLNSMIAEYEKAINPSELGWAKQLAYERGSFSTLLSVQIKDGKCLINAAGDTEVFLIAKGRIKEKYPYTSPDQFLSGPYLLSTKSELNENFCKLVNNGQFSKEIMIKNTTHILLLTDALAHWLMKHENDKKAVFKLLSIKTDEDFLTFVESERKKDLKFDDTTMIRIDLYDKISREKISPSFGRRKKRRPMKKFLRTCGKRKKN